MEIYKIATLGDDPWSEELKLELVNSPHYKTVKQWIEDKNAIMEETAYYKWLKHQLDADGSVWCGILKNDEDIARQHDNFKRLFSTAPNFVEKPLTSEVVNGQTHYYGPICVKIANNGKITIWDGMHRISILLALNLPIQFTICERQKGWQKIVDDLKALCPTIMYQPVPHPDFEDWACCNNDIKELQIANIVKEHNIKSILDLGSCHGHTLYSLRNIIESAVGVEYDQRRYAIMKLLFDKLGFESHNANMFDIRRSETHFDCVFALAVFHHFSKENPIEKLIELLDHIKRISNTLLYELPEPDEEQYDWMYQNTDMHNLIQSRYKNVTVVPMQKRNLILLDNNV